MSVSPICCAELREAGHGVLIVDHDIELLSKICDRLVCLDRGTVIAVGRPGEVRRDSKVRATFLGLAAPVLSGAEG